METTVTKKEAREILLKLGYKENEVENWLQSIYLNPLDEKNAVVGVSVFVRAAFLYYRED